MPASDTRIVGCITDWQLWQQAADGSLPLPCDVIELRVDALPPDVTYDDVLAHPCPKPLLVTVRDAAEGGVREMPYVLRSAWALKLLPMAAMLDWELANLEKAPAMAQLVHAAGVQLVASFHDFNATPALDDLLAKERRARELGADIAKFAFRLNSGQDMQVGLDLLARASGPVAVMGMGPQAAESRLLYARQGSRLVYGYLGSTPAAPGQTPAEFLHAQLRGGK
ncbi:MAG: type I 3-dehydroquinate dehydratase [Akkermansia sp.]|nr:type I 3-dehydroquinate dehydratase [Akkermansia sp.]